MNPLILELATKAGLYVDVNGKPWPRNMNGEDIEGAYSKFAELIMQEMEHDELRACVKEFFEEYLNLREESDSGRMFAPVQVSSVRSMLVEPLGELLEKMRVLSGAKEADDE